MCVCFFLYSGYIRVITRTVFRLLSRVVMLGIWAYACSQVDGGLDKLFITMVNWANYYNSLSLTCSLNLYLSSMCFYIAIKLKHNC